MAVPAVVKNLTYHLLKYNRKRVGSIAVCTTTLKQKKEFHSKVYHKLTNRRKNMKIIFYFACFIICLFTSCKNSSTNNQDTYAGEYPFERRQYDIIADPPVAIEDTTISLKVTCYPKFTGTGWMAISLGATSQYFTVLEFPYRDTLKVYTEIRVRTNFQAETPFTQEWKFRLLFKPGDYSIAVNAAYDSIFIADSVKMYPIDSPELRKINWIEPGGPLQYFTLPKP